MALPSGSRCAIFVIGEPPLIAEMCKGGFRISEEPEEIQYVVVSFDRTFDFRKLNVALQAIEMGTPFNGLEGDFRLPQIECRPPSH